LALSAGTVGESYRGGRLGEESFILDGLGVKNQLDASNGGLGIVIPPEVLSEAALVTNGFSARYGQALSGLINVVTKDPSSSWDGRVAYETDRPRQTDP
jgi:outer membrane receptor protein involved in Fe transport